MSKPETIVSHHEHDAIRLRTYIPGFVLSVSLTVAAYYIVVNRSFSRITLISAILVLAMIQFTVQIIFFLHLGAERKPRWKFLVFAFMFGTVLILALGSIWIMNNLNYHMMGEHDLLHHMKVEEGL